MSPSIPSSEEPSNIDNSYTHNNTNHHNNNNNNTDDDETTKRKVSRRSVACKSCHSLKVKCTPSDPNNPAAPCMRCLSANRKCEIDLNQTRKRRKKAEILEERRLAEEEKLKQQHQQSLESPSAPSNTTETPPFQPASIHSAPLSAVSSAPPPFSHFPQPPILPSPNNYMDNSPYSKDREILQLKSKIKQLESQLGSKHMLKSVDVTTDFVNSPPFISKFDLEHEINIFAESSAKLNELTNDLNNVADRRTKLLKDSSSKADVVSKGIISLEEANFRFNLYQNEIYKNMRLVQVSETCEELRNTQPFLFNCIMSSTNIVSRSHNIDQALMLDNEAIRSIANEVLVTGTKSIELVKGFLVLCLYYNSPELFKQRRYHLLNTICVSLLHDLGIVARPTYSYNSTEGAIRQTADKSTDEYRSLILIIYFSTVSICLVLRRSIYVKWTTYVEQCCKILENSNQYNYKKLALFAKMNHELEKIHHVIHTPDVSHIHKTTSQYIIQEFQKRLNLLKCNIESNDHFFLSYYYSIEAYLHEPNLTTVFKNDNELDNSAIRSISNCTNSCLNALDEYNALSCEQVTYAPFTFSSRIMYTAGMLLRLRYLILSLPSHIEKELVPRQAVLAIQKVSKLVEQANLQYPTNHLLKKIRLVLQLFIQTYATQVNLLLRKNGETPQNFKPTEKEASELEKLAYIYTDARAANKGSLVHDESTVAMPLDILSYAASFKNEKSKPQNKQQTQQQQQHHQQPQQRNTNSPKSSKSMTESLDNQPNNRYIPAFNSAGNTPVANSPLSKNGFTSYNQLSQPQPQTQPQPQIQSHTVQNDQLGNLSNDYRQFRLPSISNTMQTIPNPNLANQEQLENSYMVLNDEFWSNLLSTDSTDKINFSNNNTNTNQFNDEVFFMN